MDKQRVKKLETRLKTSRFMGQTDKSPSWKVANYLLNIDSMLVTFMNKLFRLVKCSYKSVTLPIRT